MTNKGVELLIGGIPVKTGNFSWQISANFAKNNNELISLIEDLEGYVFNTTNSGNIALQATVGGGYGDIYGTYLRRNDAGQLVVDAATAVLRLRLKKLFGKFTTGLDWRINKYINL